MGESCTNTGPATNLRTLIPKHKSMCTPQPPLVLALVPTPDLASHIATAPYKPMPYFHKALPGTPDHCLITRFIATIYWKSTPQALLLCNSKGHSRHSMQLLLVPECVCVCVCAYVGWFYNPFLVTPQLTSAEPSLAHWMTWAQRACKWITLTDTVQRLCFKQNTASFSSIGR